MGQDGGSSGTARGRPTTSHKLPRRSRQRLYLPGDSFTPPNSSCIAAWRWRPSRGAQEGRRATDFARFQNEHAAPGADPPHHGAATDTSAGALGLVGAVSLPTAGRSFRQGRAFPSVGWRTGLSRPPGCAYGRARRSCVITLGRPKDFGRRGSDLRRQQGDGEWLLATRIGSEDALVACVPAHGAPPPLGKRRRS